MIKLIATDMDGTLLRDDKSYAEDFEEVFVRLKAKNIKFVIASGNQYALLKSKFPDSINNDIYYLCENGTQIVYQDQTIYKDVLNFQDVKRLLKIIQPFKDCMIVMSGVKRDYVHKKYLAKKAYINLFMKDVEFVDDYLSVDDEIFNFSVANFNDSYTNDYQQIASRLPKHLKLITTGNVWFDIMKKEVNKATGLKFLGDYLKIKPEECVAFGDQMNDYELIKEVKYGYAMANAMPEVKAIAYEVIDSNENDGVVKKIKEIIRGE